MHRLSLGSIGARTVKEVFAGCRGKFGRCESGVIWGYSLCIMWAGSLAGEE